MPVMDALKNINAFDKNAKVIMISAMGQETVVRKAIILGAIGFVVKLFNQETITKAFNKL